MNKHYKIKIIEERNGIRHTINVEALAPSEQAVINWYGLEEPDIVYYEITEVNNGNK